MASEEQHYTPEFKKKVAEKALEQDEKNLDALSGEFDLPVSVILMWTEEYKKEGADAWDKEVSPTQSEKAGDEMEVEVEITDPEIADSVDTGVMLDRLNIKRLAFWSILGIILVLIFIQSLYEMNQYNTQVTQQRVSAESQYYQVNQLKEEARNRLSSFGVVDLENGIYRIPIDSAINEMASEE